MRSLFSGCVVPEVAILPWPPLLLSKPCNQCAALCTRMSQDAPAKTQQNFWWTAVAQSSANQVLLMSLSSYVRPFEANKVFAVWHILLGSNKAAVGSIHKVSWKKKKKTPVQPIGACWKQLVENMDCQEPVHSWGYYWMFPCCWPKVLM